MVAHAIASRFVASRILPGRFFDWITFVTEGIQHSYFGIYVRRQYGPIATMTYVSQYNPSN
jgi:hypothetical protein